jgi:hypothetical protein
MSKPKGTVTTFRINDLSNWENFSSVDMDFYFAELRDRMLDSLFSADRDSLTNTFKVLRKTYFQLRRNVHHPIEEGSEYQLGRLSCYIDFAAQAARRIYPKEICDMVMEQPNLQKIIVALEDTSEIHVAELSKFVGEPSIPQLNKDLNMLEKMGAVVCARSGEHCYIRATPAGKSLALLLGDSCNSEL